MEYDVGEKVLVFTRGTKGKLVCLWSDEATIVKRVNRNTYTVLYPDGSTRDISTQRLRKSVPKKTTLDPIGPFTTDYPHFMEGESKGKSADLDLDLLDRQIISRNTRPANTRYKRIDQDGKQSLDNEDIAVTYGQFVAYKVSNGWRVGQYLGDHPGVPKGSLKIRAMNILPSKALYKPRQAIWRYEWQAERGRNVVAPNGSKPHDRPSSKNTGTLNSHT